MSKEMILTSVANALKQNKISQVEVGYKDFINHSSSDILKEYIDLQSANKASVRESNNVLDDIKAILREIGTQKAIYTLELDNFLAPIKNECHLIAYDKSVDSVRDELFGIDTSIIQAKCGIADIGVFGLYSSKDSPRLASLITKNCIVILNKNDIVQSLASGIKKLRGDKDFLPSNMILIAGPSRTADIELKTVFGVHGPQQVYILLV